MAAPKKHKKPAGKHTKALAARERALAVRETGIQLREEASGREEHAVAEREASVDTREDEIGLREELVRAREEAASSRVEQEQLLRDLKEANQRLILASIRSQELAEVADEARHQLELSERELREVAGFRERLIGIVGHDLRNPLSAIWVAVDLLTDRLRSGGEAANLVERIRRSTRRMGTMIEQLLDFTRAHAGDGLPLELKPTDLAEVCRKIVDELELGHTAPHRFTCDFQGDLQGTWDPDRLAQVISNLGANAIAHGTPDRPIVLRGRGDGDHVVLEVNNYGEPIRPDSLPFIFDPFSRAKRKGKTSGLGLGLYISHHIVLAHGGTIEARSDARDGTTFTVRLPRHPTPQRVRM